MKFKEHKKFSAHFTNLMLYVTEITDITSKRDSFGMAENSGEIL